MSDSPVLQFSYLTLYDMGKLSEIMVVKPYVLQGVIDHHFLSRNKDDRAVQVCPIIEIPFDDLLKFPEDHFFWTTYNYLVERFGQDIVDMCIPKNCDSIKRKIMDIIPVTMDQVYKSSDLLIEFNKYNVVQGRHGLIRANSSVSDLIYESAQTNFDIVDQELSEQICYIHIEKRRNNND